MAEQVSVAVIPVAGFGTRMLPASKATPKEMVPVLDRPAIQWVVDEAVASGIETIVLVTQSSKVAIENHFDRNAELEAYVAPKGDARLSAIAGRLLPDNVTLVAVRQPSAAGLGQAISCAAPVIAGRPFAVLLPDVLVDTGSGDTDLKIMMARYRDSGRSQVMVSEVPESEVYKYGTVDMQGKVPAPGESLPVVGVVEKAPHPEAPSCFAVVGRYVFAADILQDLAVEQPDHRGEIQLTGAIASLIRRAGCDAFSLTGHTFDCGSPAGWLAANLFHARRDDNLWQAIQSALPENG